MSICVAYATSRHNEVTTTFVYDEDCDSLDLIEEALDDGELVYNDEDSTASTNNF
jgi:hypothetical protein